MGTVSSRSKYIRSVEDKQIIPIPELYPNVMRNSRGIWQRWRYISHDPYYYKQCKPRGIIIGMHGLGGHITEFECWVHFLTKAGYCVYILEHEGHGRSEGQTITCEAYQHLFTNQVYFIKNVVQPHCEEREMSDIPKFLFGISMGGAISVYIENILHNYIKGVILICPLLCADPKIFIPYKLYLVYKFKQLFPFYPVGSVDLSGSTDHKVALSERKYDRVSIINGPLQMHMAYELYLLSTGLYKPFPVLEEDIYSNHINNNTTVVSNFKTPVLIIHGEKDTVTLPQGSIDFFENISSVDKQINILPRAKHHITSESEETRNKYQSLILDWLNCHL